MYLSVHELEKIVYQKVQEGDFHGGLHCIESFTEGICSDQRAVGKIYCSPKLDNLCQKIGSIILKQKFNILPDKSILQPNLTVYIATELYVTGGHTAVIEDLIRCRPNRKHLILITDINQNVDIKAICERFSSLDVKIYSSTTENYLDKVIWLQSLLMKEHSGEVYLFNHHYDSVAVASVQPQLVSNLLFYHHGDHQLCLGVSIPYATHIDPHPSIYHICRERNNIKNNFYLPLPSNDLGNRPLSFQFFKDGRLITCTSGNAGKFDRPYSYSYTNIIAEVMEITKGIHIHIGPLPEHTIEKIKEKLSEKEIPHTSFVHIEHVKSLWLALHEFMIDLYIDSFPIGGGKAVIEVMGSGTPVVVHRNYRSGSLSTYNIIYPEAFSWQEPHELYSVLASLTPSCLLEHSCYARKHYERYHTYSYFTEQLDKILEAGEPTQAPELKSYPLDTLQSFVDMSNYQEDLFDRTYEVSQKKLEEVRLRFLLRPLPYKIFKSFIYLIRRILTNGIG